MKKYRQNQKAEGRSCDEKTSPHMEGVGGVQMTTKSTTQRNKDLKDLMVIAKHTTDCCASYSRGYFFKKVFPDLSMFFRCFPCVNPPSPDNLAVIRRSRIRFLSAFQTAFDSSRPVPSAVYGYPAEKGGRPRSQESDPLPPRFSVGAQR